MEDSLSSNTKKPYQLVKDITREKQVKINTSKTRMAMASQKERKSWKGG